MPDTPHPVTNCCVCAIAIELVMHIDPQVMASKFETLTRDSRETIVFTGNLNFGLSGSHRLVVRSVAVVTIRNRVASGNVAKIRRCVGCRAI
jgi:hypothetical protein